MWLESCQIRVSVGNNKLGNTLGNTCNYNKQNILGFAKYLTGLIVLDISHNMINSGNSLEPLRNLSNLRILDLSSNILHNFSLDLTNMDNLIKLNLSNNNLKYLSKRVILQLNELQAIKLNSFHYRSWSIWKLIIMHMWKLIFLSIGWSKTNIFMVNQKEYQCEFDGGRIQKLDQLQNIIEIIEKQCYSVTWMKLCVGLEILYFTLVTLFSFALQIQTYH